MYMDLKLHANSLPKKCSYLQGNFYDLYSKANLELNLHTYTHETITFYEFSPYIMILIKNSYMFWERASHNAHFIS